MAARTGSAAGDGARRRGETDLPHITWPDLRGRYHEAETYEERLGLIHASRRAVVQSQLDSGPEESRRLRNRVQFLTAIGDEVNVKEADPELRHHARLALVRHCLPDKLHSPVKVSPDPSWSEDFVEPYRESAVAIVVFLSACEAHCAGIDGEDLKRVHKFLDARWYGCPQPDDADQRTGGLRFSRDEAGLIDRSVILRALVNTHHYATLQHVWDAAPYLYVMLTNTIRRYVPSYRLPVELEWLPVGKSTRWIDAHLSSNPTARDRFWLDHTLILQDCGYVLGRHQEAEPIARALLELLARLHAGMMLIAQQSTT